MDFSYKIVFLSVTADLIQANPISMVERNISSDQFAHIAARYSTIEEAWRNSFSVLPTSSFLHTHERHPDLVSAVEGFLSDLDDLLPEPLVKKIHSVVEIWIETHGSPSPIRYPTLLEKALHFRFSDDFNLDTAIVMERTAERAPRSEKPVLHFLLSGERARGEMIVAGSAAKLIFRYGIQEEEILLALNDAALDRARLEDADIELHATPGPGLSLVGAHRVVARFRGQRLQSEPVFLLEAAISSAGDSHVHISFNRCGLVLVEIKLVVRIVADESELAIGASTQVVPVEAGSLTHEARKIGLSRHIQLKLFLGSGGRLHVALDATESGESTCSWAKASEKFGGAELAALIGKVQGRLGDDFYIRDAWSTFKGRGAADDAHAQALREATSRMAEAGWLLFSELCRDDVLKKALEYVDSASQGTRVTIRTSEIFLPWEILYSRFFTRRAPTGEVEKYSLETSKFWGLRFAIETAYMGEGDYGSLLRAQRTRPTKLSFNVSPSIRLSNLAREDQPAAVHEAWLARLTATPIERNDNCDAMRSVLQAGHSDATFIYVYCHGDTPVPFATSGAEMLQLDEQCVLEPADILPGEEFSGAPVVLLNACKSASFSPLTFSNFLQKFREKKALGLIATTFSVPINFAAHFGEEIVQVYLARKDNLAEALRALRVQHMSKGDPMPLFYAVQCQLDFRK